MNNSQKPSLLLSGKSSLRQSPTRRETGWFSAKNETRESQTLKQITLLLNKNVMALSKALRPVLGDLEVSWPARPSSSEIEDIESQRDRIFNQGLERLVKCLLARNSEAKRATEAYSMEYREKYNQPLLTLAVDDKNARSSQTSSRARIRPMSSKPLRQISRSLIMETQKQTKDPPVILEAVARFAQFQSKELPKFFSNMDYTSRFASAKLEKSERSPDPLAVMLELGSSRASYLECAGQFLPTFSYKRSANRGNSASLSKRDEVALFKARISVLNSDYQVRVAKQQQAYKKRQRDPTLFSNVFI